jgi:putative addiction module component (TIGR02574 family)
MDTQPKQILDVALTLPESDRAGLAASLIRSLDDAPDPDADVKWATEIERRIRSIDGGSVELEAWDAVMAEMRDRRNG